MKVRNSGTSSSMNHYTFVKFTSLLSLFIQRPALFHLIVKSDSKDIRNARLGEASPSSSSPGDVI